MCLGVLYRHYYIVTCQVHPVLLKRVQCTVHSFSFNCVSTCEWTKGSLAPVLSLSGVRVVCWRPHPAGTRQYIQLMVESLTILWKTIWDVDKNGTLKTLLDTGSQLARDRFVTGS